MNRADRFKLWFLQRIKRPIDIPELLRATAGLFLVITVLIAFVVVLDQGNDRERSLTAQLAKAERDRDSQQALNDCRSGLAAEGVAAAYGHQLVIGQLVVALGSSDREGFAARLDDLSVAGQRLAAAIEARITFEQTQECPS